jgi:hypothetical protein
MQFFRLYMGTYGIPLPDLIVSVFDEAYMEATRVHVSPSCASTAVSYTAASFSLSPPGMGQLSCCVSCSCKACIFTLFTLFTVISGMMLLVHVFCNDALRTEETRWSSLGIIFSAVMCLSTSSQSINLISKPRLRKDGTGPPPDASCPKYASV